MGQVNDFGKVWLPPEDESVVTPEDIARLMPHAPAWAVVRRQGQPRLQRVFVCKTFSDAMWLVLMVGDLAEREGQRPVILVDWTRVTIVLRSGEAKGLQRADFLCAAKIDTLWQDKPRSDA